MHRYHHIPRTTDTARILTPSGRNCLAVSGMTTPPLKSATGAQKGAEAKCVHKARRSPTAGLLRALWRVCASMYPKNYITMKRKTLILSFYSLLFFLAMGMVSCEKPILDEGTGNEIPAEANVILHFVQYEQEAFTRAATDITELCSRLNIALFDADGTKVKTVAQKEGDANYGTVALSLAAGTYRLVVIAHNGEGSATITSEEKVTFPNNKVTDTFYYYGDLVVTSEKQNYDLTLTRAVAMFRLVLTDESIPSTVAKMKFYYLGGSSTFSPKDGYGCVNSKQTEIRPMADDGIYEIYTLPHTEDDVLTKLTVTALDGNDNIIKEIVFEDIPVTRNQVTRYTGSFFGNSGGETGSGDFRMTADPDWDAVNSFTF